MNFDFANPFIESVAAALAGALLIWAFTRFLKFIFWPLSLFISKKRLSTRLERYKKHLLDKILDLKHPWMKEKQTLAEVLVSINFVSDSGREHERLEIFLARTLRKNPSSRILILGDPGSGKSIAMRVIAKSIWSIELEQSLVPILLTFTDIRKVDSEEAFEQVIVDKLKYYQFDKGKKKTNLANAFLRNNLDSGKILILIDGYDELDKAIRTNLAVFLNQYFGKYPLIPVIISSRIGVYQNEPVFSPLVDQSVRMAPFTRFSIMKFLAQWKFEGMKSAQELMEKINGKAHLSDLASNPLMLTMIAYLYSLPKYQLPDNRVQFYNICSQALLEEWDRATSSGRSNRFESHQKIAILSRIAFEHLSSSPLSDEFIAEAKVLALIREEMAKLSLKQETYVEMKNEIVLNSGLLQYVPNAEYRFPHRTFLEYFAASYIYMSGNPESLLSFFKLDQSKWREVLLLWVGINRNPVPTKAILSVLLDTFWESAGNGAEVNTIVFRALNESAISDPEDSIRILDSAKEYMFFNGAHKEIIDDLGCIAANPNWVHAERAGTILIELLAMKMPNDIYQQLLLSLLYMNNKRIYDLIISNIEKFNTIDLFSRLGSKVKPFVQKLLEGNPPMRETERIIEGLRESGNLEILALLMVETKNSLIREYTAYTLVRMSKLHEFFEFLDGMNLGILDTQLEIGVEEKYKFWGWPWDDIETPHGKKAAIAISWFSAQYLCHRPQESYNIELQRIFDESHHRMLHLTVGILLESEVPFHADDFINQRTLKQYLSSIGDRLCRSRKSKSGLRSRLANASSGEMLIEMLVGTNNVIAIYGILGGILLTMGSTSCRIYNYFYNNITVYLIISLLLYSISIYVLLTPSSKSNKDMLWLSMILSFLIIPIILCDFYGRSNKIGWLTLFLGFYIMTLIYLILVIKMVIVIRVILACNVFFGAIIFEDILLVLLSERFKRGDNFAHNLIGLSDRTPNEIT